MTLLQQELKTEIGIWHLVASDEALVGLYFKKQPRIEVGMNPILKQALKEVNEYLAGKREEFSIKIDLEGTPFQKRVWEELLKIPYGETISYRELAKRVGNPKAFRAVGTANGKNPIAIIIPCHRVIAANGTLGGYAGGIPTKEFLLKLERPGPRPGV